MIKYVQRLFVGFCLILIQVESQRRPATPEVHDTLGFPMRRGSKRKFAPDAHPVIVLRNYGGITSCDDEFNAVPQVNPW